MIAVNGIHYQLVQYPDGVRTFQFTYQGACDLTFQQRSDIEHAFWQKTLGDSIDVSAPTIEEQRNEFSEENIEYGECQPSEDDNLADRLHERQKDGWWSGQLGLVFNR